MTETNLEKNNTFYDILGIKRDIAGEKLEDKVIEKANVSGNKDENIIGNLSEQTDNNIDEKFNKEINEKFICEILKIYPKKNELSDVQKRQLKKIVFAYEILKDPQKKNIYDNYLANKVEYGNELKNILIDLQKKLDLLLSLNYVRFIRYLQHEYKIITSIRANALIGLLYEEIDSSLDKVDNIDPEDIIPKMPLYKEIFYEFLVLIVFLLVYVLLIIIIVFLG